MEPQRKHYSWARQLLFGLSLFLPILCSVSLAQEVTPITSSGLNTTVSAPITLPSGETQFDITGGTRPGGGVNLFHSFGNFDVPHNNIANFLNTSGLATSNILGRVTGGNVSDIFGTIQTTGFGNANLFLMNPEGFLFGPNATVNVGGMVAFTSADYLRLADNARFNAIPHTAPDLLLSAAPVAAFGFLGSHPGAITVQGSQLSVTDGTGISLVGGKIRVQAGELTAPSGQINLVSVNKPSHSKVGGEVVVGGAGQGSGFIPTGFKSLGPITLSQSSTISTSQTPGSGHAGGTILIRGGRFIMDASVLEARAPQALPGVAGGYIEVTAKHVALSNHSSVDTSTARGPGGATGNITFDVNTFSATDSAILANVIDGGSGGAVTIQGFQGSGASAHSVSLTNTTINTSSRGLPGFPGPPKADGGPIVVRADKIVLSQSSLNAHSDENIGGAISLVSSGRIKSHDSSFNSSSFYRSGGTVDLRAGTRIDLISSEIKTDSPASGNGGSITMLAPRISIRGSTLTTSVSDAPHTVAGTITIDANALKVKNSQILSTATEGQGGTIDITSHNRHPITNSVIDATSQFGTDGTVTIERR